MLYAAVSARTLSNPSFRCAALWWWLTCSDVLFSLLSYSLHFPLPFPTTHSSFLLLFCCLKVLAGMNVHPAEFDGLKQEYNVKGYPTFCYFEWVESSHPSHFRLIPHFQGSEHESRATSNTESRPGLLNSSGPDGGRWEGESLWQALGSSGAPFETK